MGKIVAIGGGSIGYRGSPLNTIPLDREMIRLSGKKHPKLLLLPTASGDSPDYFKIVSTYFGERLGCAIDVLYLVKDPPSLKEIEKKVLSSDIVYVGGGNTLFLMKIWRKTGLDTILKKAYQKGVILAGVSAGAGCWFEYLNSDSRRTKENPQAPFIRVKGLGLAAAFMSPHYNESGRRTSVKTMAKRYNSLIIGLENCTALEIVDAQWRILSSKPGKTAFRCFWKAGKYVKERLEIGKWFALTELRQAW